MDKLEKTNFDFLALILENASPDQLKDVIKSQAKVIQELQLQVYKLHQQNQSLLKLQVSSNLFYN